MSGKSFHFAFQPFFGHKSRASELTQMDEMRNKIVMLRSVLYLLLLQSPLLAIAPAMQGRRHSLTFAVGLLLFHQFYWPLNYQLRGICQ